MLNLEVNEVIHWRIAGLFFEQAREVRRRQVCLSCNGGKRQRSMHVLLQERERRVEIMKITRLERRRKCAIIEEQTSEQVVKGL